MSTLESNLDCAANGWNESIEYSEPARLTQTPLNRVVLRDQPEDFVVREDLGFVPSGSGEHLFLHIRKRGENTAWVAEQLAKHFQVSPKAVAYAGKKDRHAATDQWFSIHLPGSESATSLDRFQSDSIQILEAQRHQRKLKLGVLRGNFFSIRLQSDSPFVQLDQRIEQIARGVPNYFGEQRFGYQGNNLTNGVKLLAGKIQVKQRHKRGLYLSAVRSYLFNQVVEARVIKGNLFSPINGDVLIDPMTQSCVHFDPTSAQLNAEFEQSMRVVSAPLWGRGELYTRGLAKNMEQEVLEPHTSVLKQLESVGLRQERRAAVLIPQQLAFTQVTDRECRLEFYLPAGCFATSVLRELCRW